MSIPAPTDALGFSLRTVGAVLLWGVVAATLVACGDDTGPGPVEESPPQPVTFTRAQRGFGAFPGDGTIIQQVAAEAELDEIFSTLVLRRQLLDELTISREGTAAVPRARFAAQTRALRDEIEAVQTFEKVVLVLDLMKVSDGSRLGAPVPYLTSWDENERDPDRYGFWRTDYREAILEDVTEAASDHQPDIIVVGAEMERYLGMPGGEHDFANFVTFYREAYTAIKQASPATRVGVGIDWIRFQLDLVPAEVLELYEVPDEVELEEGVLTVSCANLPGDAEAQAALRSACTAKAFERYIAPFLRYLDPVQPPPEGGKDVEPVWVVTADVIALSARPTQSDFGNTPANCPEDFFAPLRDWSKTMPVVYYRASWETNSPVGFAKQNEWLQILIERNLGVQVDLIAWPLLKDLIASDCGKLTNDLGAPDAICLDGMWKDSTSPKDVYTTLSTDIVPPPPEPTE